MDKKETIEEFIRLHKERETLIDKLQELFGFSDGVLMYETLFSMENFVLNLAAEKIGDKGDWLEWFVYDNECGSKGYEVTINGKEKKIKTVDDLLEVIEHD